MKTNRDYFSWSQYNLWHTSKREFWKQYNQSIKGKGIKFFDKGKELANFMETGVVPTQCKDPMLEAVAEQMPRLEYIEECLEVPYKDTKLLGFIDSSQKDGSIFMEYKTGKVAWTQERTDEHDQLLFYAYMFFIKNGRIPSCRLVWVETMDTDDGLMYTGEIHAFDRTFTTQEIRDFGKKIDKTLKEIEKFEYKELEADADDVKRYSVLMERKAEIDEELNLIKMKIHEKMTANDVTFAKGHEGNFIITRRKRWKYSAVVDEMAAALKKEQIKEQKFGTASNTVSESIMFKFNKS